MSDERRSLLWHSNSPWSPTGYGSQTALFADRLRDKYRVGISSFYGLEGNVLPWKGLPTYPGIGVTHGNETIRAHAGVHFANGLRDGLVVSLMDVWVLDPAVWRRVNHAAWTPVDHEPLPPPIEGFFRGSGAVPIAMSRFGERQLQEAGLDPLYCPHGVDTEVYRPIAKDKARETTKMPQNAFVVGMVAANKGNPSRKCFSEAFQAFARFHQNHPEARLYLHTEATGKFDGVNLPDLARACGVDLELILFADQYRVVHYPFPPETMAAVFSSLDVLLAPSAGEGFGIPVIEAQACGVPVIVSDFSAQPELVGAGWTVSGHRFFTPLKAWQFHPDPDDILEALGRVYALPDAARKDCAAKARAKAEEYAVGRVLEEYMLPALDEAWGRFTDREPLEVSPRDEIPVAA